MSQHTLKRIAVLGEIGSGNLGDDWGYVLLRDELQAAFRELDILTDIRPLTPNMNWQLGGYHWDAVVTGCGTLLDQANGPYVRALIDASNKSPVAVLGSGVSDPRHQTPTPEGRRAFDDLLIRSRYGWLRNVPDGYGPEAIGPDPLWLHGYHGDSEGRPCIGINAGYAGFTTLNLDPQFLFMAASVRRLLGEKKQRTVLFSAWNADNVWLERIKQPDEEILPVTGTQETIVRLNACTAVLTTRIHLGVLAACRGAHPVLPDYATKVRAVFGAVPFTAVAVGGSAQAHVNALLAERPSAAKAVEEAQKQAKKRVRDAAQAIAGAW